MNFNSLFFPAPSNHYSVVTHFGEMIYIPKDFEMVLDERTGESHPRLNTAHFLEDRAKARTMKHQKPSLRLETNFTDMASRGGKTGRAEQLFRPYSKDEQRKIKERSFTDSVMLQKAESIN